MLCQALMTSQCLFYVGYLYFWKYKCIYDIGLCFMLRYSPCYKTPLILLSSAFPFHLWLSRRVRILYKCGSCSFSRVALLFTSNFSFSSHHARPQALSEIFVFISIVVTNFLSCLHFGRAGFSCTRFIQVLSS